VRFPDAVVSATPGATDLRLQLEAAATERGAEESRSVVVFGKPTETNDALVAAFAGLGHRARLVCGPPEPGLARGDIAIGRIDVLPTLDGVEPGLRHLSRLERQGVHVLNRPGALLAAHDKLSTALFLGRAGVAQPRTAHVRDVSVPSFSPPYVVKPRFGSWGQEVHLSRDEDELRALLERLADESWFRRHGALVQSLVEPTGRDLRVVVAAGRVVGGIERCAVPGEWRTNVALGGVRRQVEPSLAARALALRAVAALGIDLAGVDIAGDEYGRASVIEVNGAVDFTPEYGTDVFASAATALLRMAAAREARASRPRERSDRLEAIDGDGLSELAPDGLGAVGVAAQP
jgi:RimK family alpha-L-glutamate ligase